MFLEFELGEIDGDLRLGIESVYISHLIFKLILIKFHNSRNEWIKEKIDD